MDLGRLPQGAQLCSSKRKRGRPSVFDHASSHSALLIYTSSARTQYVRHVLAASGMPRGSIIRNRYDRRWVHPSVWSDWESGGLIGERVVICYLEGEETRPTGLVAAPVRWGTVRTCKTYGQYGILDVELDSMTGGRPLCETTASASRSGIVDPGPAQGMLVVRVSVHPRAKMDVNDDLTEWQRSVTQLAQLRTLRGASFIYLHTVHGKGRTRELDLVEGTYFVRPRTFYEIVVYGISPDIRSDSHRYKVQFDDNIVELLDHIEFGLGYRFDLIRIPLRIKGGQASYSTRLRVGPITGTMGPEIEIRLEVHDRPIYRGLSFIAPGAAAALAASAGVLPPNTPLWIRVSMVVTGSAGLAIANRLRR